MRWISRLRAQVAHGWSDPPGVPLREDGLLDGAFLQQLEKMLLRVQRGATGGFTGEHASRHTAQSVEFADYRNYMPGDDLRLIDWNVYARLGQLTLRLTEAPEATTLHLLLDCSGSMAWGVPSKLRYLQRLAAALGCIALARYDTVSIGMLRGGTARRLPRLRGKEETRRLLAVLEGLHAQGDLDLAAAVQSYCGSRQRGVGVIISDLLGPQGVRDAVSHLRRAGLQPVVLQVLAREDSSPSLEGPLDLVDCETGAVVTTAIDGNMLHAYTERFSGWTAGLQQDCESLRATYIQLTTDQPLEDLIFGTLRRQQVVQ